MCNVCGMEFCFGHLGSHEHKFADIRGVTNKLDVIGVGRVGSYAKAKASHRSRNRRFWAIGYFDNRDSGLLGYRIVADSPHFKTKSEAEIYFGKLTATRG